MQTHKNDTKTQTQKHNKNTNTQKHKRANTEKHKHNATATFDHTWNVQYNVRSVLLRTTQYNTVLFRTTKCYSVLRSTNKYDSALHSTTTDYYSILQSTTPYHKVLHNTTPYYTALLRTTKCYSVLQSTTYTILLRTTQYYKVLLLRAGLRGLRGPARARGLYGPTRAPAGPPHRAHTGAGPRARTTGGPNPLTCYCNFLFCMHKSCLTWKTLLSLYSCGFWINIVFRDQKLVAAGGKQFSSSWVSSWEESSIHDVCVFSNACLLYFCFRSLRFFVGLSWSGWPGSRSTCSKMVVSSQDRWVQAMATCCCFLDLTKPSRWFVVCCSSEVGLQENKQSYPFIQTSCVCQS